MTKKSATASEDRLDPDVRFLLSNERTLLAWLRTALAVLAGGLALIQLSDGSVRQTWFGVATILFGALTAALGFVRFQAADRAIRSAHLPRAGHGPALEVLAVVVFACVIAVIELLQIN